tara:strand:+ start:8569 stop:9288 length:720 start_codon:yes stop_codon:yes gene_type:complete
MKIPKTKKILIELSDFILRITSNNSPKIQIDKSKPHSKDEAFAKILNLLNSINIDYFISGGTLLGIYRDGKLIEWDDDIDIDVLSYSYRKNIKKIIDFAHKNGYSYQIGSNYFHPKISLYISNTKVSLAAITRGLFKRNYFYRSKYRLPFKICKKSINFKINNNLFAKVPVRAIDYLKFLYGESWSTPIIWEHDDDNKYYNFGYIRSGKRYVLLNYFQLILSKFIYLFKDYFCNIFIKK